MLLVATDSRPRNLSCGSYSNIHFNTGEMGKLAVSLLLRFRSASRERRSQATRRKSVRAE